MKIAIHFRQFRPYYTEMMLQLSHHLSKNKGKILLQRSLFLGLPDELKQQTGIEIIDNEILVRNQADFVFSLGGDGTMLETLDKIKDSGIPALGINYGRLGFLSNAQPGDIMQILEVLDRQKHTISRRSLIEYEIIKGEQIMLRGHSLNEITIQKRDLTNLITIHVYIDGNFASTYWSDGVIVATPTGSTAYNLSCGGPILSPDSENFILTPIAPHNLTMRPLVIRDNIEITLIGESRQDEFIFTADSSTYAFDNNCRIKIKKAPFMLNLVQLPNDFFYRLLREKLMWGEDKRN